MTPQISIAQRRARLAHRHRLVRADASGPEAVADDLVVLHATDPATIYLAIAARSSGVTVADIDRALFEDRTMMRTMAMRRTLYVPTRDAIPIVEQSSSGAIAATERKVLVKYLTNSGIKTPAAMVGSSDGAGT